MSKTLMKMNGLTVRKWKLLAALTVPLIAQSAGAAWAAGSFAASSLGTEGGAVATSRGPALITGSLGSLQTTTLPGSGGQGLLMNNGNGTSTLIVTGGLPQVVASPR